MEAYLIKSNIAIVLFYILYRFILFYKINHQTKRFVGLFILLFCSFLPLFPTFKVQKVKVPAGVESIIESGAQWSAAIGQRQEEETSIFLIIYFSGLLFFGLQFIYSLCTLLWLSYRSNAQKKWHFRVVQVSKNISPFSFFGTLFIHKNDVPHDAIILHEQVHKNQLHSLDVLFLEVLSLVFWFNPFVWLFKRDIKASHEFLADQSVIEKGHSRLEYQNLLFKARTGVIYNPSNHLSNQIGLKQRFNVMNKSKINSKTNFFGLSVACVAMLIAVSISSFSPAEIMNSSTNLDIRIFTEDGVEVNDRLSRDTETLLLKIVPEDEKTSTRITKAEITLVSGGLGRGSVQFAEEINLRPLLQMMQETSTLVIEIKEYQTKDQNGNIETTYMDPAKFMSLNITE